jgi:hypothetical protein
LQRRKLGGRYHVLWVTVQNRHIDRQRHACGSRITSPDHLQGKAHSAQARAEIITLQIRRLLHGWDLGR